MVYEIKIRPTVDGTATWVLVDDGEGWRVAMKCKSFVHAFKSIKKAYKMGEDQLDAVGRDFTDYCLDVQEGMEFDADLVKLS